MYPDKILIDGLDYRFDQTTASVLSGGSDELAHDITRRHRYPDNMGTAEAARLAIDDIRHGLDGTGVAFAARRTSHERAGGVDYDIWEERMSLDGRSVDGCSAFYLGDRHVLYELTVSSSNGMDVAGVIHQILRRVERGAADVAPYVPAGDASLFSYRGRLGRARTGIRHMRAPIGDEPASRAMDEVSARLAEGAGVAADVEIPGCEFPLSVVRFGPENAPVIQSVMFAAPDRSGRRILHCLVSANPCRRKDRDLLSFAALDMLPGYMWAPHLWLALGYEMVPGATLLARRSGAGRMEPGIASDFAAYVRGGMRGDYEGVEVGGMTGVDYVRAGDDPLTAWTRLQSDAARLAGRAPLS